MASAAPERETKLPIATRLPEYETRFTGKRETPSLPETEDETSEPARDRRGSLIVVGSVVPTSDYRSMAGRPTLRSEDIVSEMIFRLSEGETLRRICRDDHMPAFVTVMAWQRADEDFKTSLAYAREDHTHAIAEDCEEISDRGDMDPRDRQVRIDTRLKLIEKWNRKDYGQKQDISHSGTISLEAWVIEATPAPKLEQARVIEGEVKPAED